MCAKRISYSKDELLFLDPKLDLSCLSDHDFKNLCEKDIFIAKLYIPERIKKKANNYNMKTMAIQSLPKSEGSPQSYSYPPRFKDDMLHSSDNFRHWPNNENESFNPMRHKSFSATQKFNNKSEIINSFQESHVYREGINQFTHNSNNINNTGARYQGPRNNFHPDFNRNKRFSPAQPASHNSGILNNHQMNNALVSGNNQGTDFINRRRNISETLDYNQNIYAAKRDNHSKYNQAQNQPIYHDTPSYYEYNPPKINENNSLGLDGPERIIKDSSKTSFNSNLKKQISLNERFSTYSPRENLAAFNENDHLSLNMNHHRDAVNKESADPNYPNYDVKRNYHFGLLENDVILNPRSVALSGKGNETLHQRNEFQPYNSTDINFDYDQHQKQVINAEKGSNSNHFNDKIRNNLDFGDLPLKPSYSHPSSHSTPQSLSRPNIILDQSINQNANLKPCPITPQRLYSTPITSPRLEETKADLDYNSLRDSLSKEIEPSISNCNFHSNVDVIHNNKSVQNIQDAAHKSTITEYLRARTPNPSRDNFYIAIDPNDNLNVTLKLYRITDFGYSPVLNQTGLPELPLFYGSELLFLLIQGVLTPDCRLENVVTQQFTLLNEVLSLKQARAVIDDSSVSDAKLSAILPTDFENYAIMLKQFSKETDTILGNFNLEKGEIGLKKNDKQSKTESWVNAQSVDNDNVAISNQILDSLPVKGGNKTKGKKDKNKKGDDLKVNTGRFEPTGKDVKGINSKKQSQVKDKKVAFNTPLIQNGSGNVKSHDKKNKSSQNSVKPTGVENARQDSKHASDLLVLNSPQLSHTKYETSHQLSNELLHVTPTLTDNDVFLDNKDSNLQSMAGDTNDGWQKIPKKIKYKKKKKSEIE